MFWQIMANIKVNKTNTGLWCYHQKQTQTGDCILWKCEWMAVAKLKGGTKYSKRSGDGSHDDVRAFVTQLLEITCSLPYI